MNNLEPEFRQAVQEVENSIRPYLDLNPQIEESKILDRLRIPDRAVIFKVTWMDDQNQLQVNTGYRVQFNNALGPYKGGIRFDESVNLSIMKFLAYEQIFKNALTGLPMGGAKGGADFNPVGKSDGEIMRFCQAYMNELYKYLGPTIDVPAGDLGVGHREIGYLLGQYKRLTGRAEGVFTGKPVGSGGSLLRTEATGFGLLYILDAAVQDINESLVGKRVLVSGAGNVGIHAALKASVLGAKVIGISNINGALFDSNGLDIETLRKLVFIERKDLTDYLEVYPHAKYVNDKRAIYFEACDVFLFCATQNEADVTEVSALMNKGCKIFAEGANMPLTNEAQHLLIDNKMLYLPGKAANAGGVSVSLMEMSQNTSFIPWSASDVDQQLKVIMTRIYNNIKQVAAYFGEPHNFVLGANISGFKRICEAMQQQGF